MTDDARIARLTELARKAWPSYPRLRSDERPQFDEVEVADGPEGESETGTLLLIEGHPRALEAMEAALCVLAGEPPQTEDMLGSLQQWWHRYALALLMTSRSVHKAIGVAISALEQGKPFPTMQVLSEPSGEPPQCTECGGYR